MEAAPIDHTVPLAAEVRQHQAATVANIVAPPVLVRARPGEPLRIEPAPSAGALPAGMPSARSGARAQTDRRSAPQAPATVAANPAIAPGQSLPPSSTHPVAHSQVHQPRLPATEMPERADSGAVERGLLPKLSRWWRESGTSAGDHARRARVQAGETRTEGIAAAPAAMIAAATMPAATAGAGLPISGGVAAVPVGFAVGMRPTQTSSTSEAAVVMRVRGQRMAVRAYPDSEAQVIGHLQQHAAVTVRGAGHGVWRRVEAGGLSGWVPESWLEAAR